MTFVMKLISLSRALPQVLLAISLLLVIPSAKILAAGGGCDVNDDGNVNSGDLIICHRQALGFDTDGDGYTPDVDCNDSRADVYPGATEICDGVDNDCDGQVDEDFQNVGQQCIVGIGACSALGYLVCAGSWLECSAMEGTPTAEICDGIDNDCDGITDNNLTPVLCAEQSGVCAGSTETCLGISGYACDTRIIPDYEFYEISCDGKDNDCDGVIDDNLVVPPCPNQAGVCAGSTRICGGISGWLLCDGNNYGPDYEAVETSCDGLDNDCD